MNPLDWGSVLSEAQRHGYHRGYWDAAPLWCMLGGLLGSVLTGIAAVLLG